MADDLTVVTAAEQLAKLRKAAGDVAPNVIDDEGLLRFFMARGGNVDKAGKMLTASLAWRQKCQLDQLPLYPDGPSTFAVRGFDFFVADVNNAVDDPKLKSVFENTGGFAVHKTDRQGNPVVIERAGLHDAAGVVRNVPLETATDFHIRCNEFLFSRLHPALAKYHGSSTGKVTLVIDCHGLGWQHLYLPALKYLLAFGQIDQDNYPERLARAFVVNAPGVFTSIWAILKRGLDKRILDKVFIFGATGYQEELAKFVDPANLPEFLGGTCKCGHMPGGCVPCLQPERLAALGHSKQYVSARDAFRLNTAIDEVGSVLTYKFTTKDYNIGFGIAYKESVEAEKESIIEPIKTRDSHQTAVSGKVTAIKPGVYTLIWDNTSSILKGKNVSYTVDVHPPGEPVSAESSGSLLASENSPSDVALSQSAPL